MECLSGFGIGNNGVNGIPTSDIGIDNFQQDIQFHIISDKMDTNAPADTDIDEQVARAKSLADYELRQTEIRNKRKLEGLRQEAVSALLQQEHKEYTQQGAQDHAQAAAQIQQIERQAQGFTYEVQGARQKERQEREVMTAEEKKARQREQQIIQREQEREQRVKRQTPEEENRRRNEEREEPVTPRAKAKAKSGPSHKKPSPKKPSPKKLKPVPPFPDGGEKASGSTDNPESAHEPKGPRGRPSNKTTN